jgi:hypothetical protein
MLCFLKFSMCNFKIYDSSPPLTSKGNFFHGPSPCANCTLPSKLMLLTQPTNSYERRTLVKLTSYHMFFVGLVKPMQGKCLKKWVKWYKWKEKTFCSLRRWKQVKVLFSKLKCENDFKGERQKVTNKNTTRLLILNLKLVLKGDGWDMKCLNWLFIMHSKHKKCETS